MAANIQPIMPDIGLANWQNAILHGIEAASQTWKVGAPLVNSSGSLAEATTGTGGYAGTIIGFALAPATGVTGADVTFVPALQGLTMAGTVDGTLNGSNAPGTGSVAQTAVWGGIGLQKDAASGLWYPLHHRHRQFHHRRTHRSSLNSQRSRARTNSASANAAHLRRFDQCQQ